MHNQTLTPAIEAALDNLRQAIAQELHHSQAAQSDNISSTPTVGDISAPNIPVAPETPPVADIPVMPTSPVVDLSASNMSTETPLSAPVPEPSTMSTPITPPTPDFVMPSTVTGSGAPSVPAGETAPASAFVLPDLHAAPSTSSDLPTPDVPAPNMATSASHDLASTQLPDLPDLNQSAPAGESVSAFTPPAPAVGFGASSNDTNATIPTPPAPHDVQIPPMSSTETGVNPTPDSDTTQQPAANGLSKANGLLSSVLKKGWGNKQ